MVLLFGVHPRTGPACAYRNMLRSELRWEVARGKRFGRNHYKGDNPHLGNR